MNDHARVPQERIQATSIWRGEEDTIRWLEGMSVDPIRSLKKLLERTLKEDGHAEEECQCDTCHDNDPR